jgi:HEAT repeat protein
MNVEEAVIDTLAGDEESKPALRESMRSDLYSVRQAAIQALSRDEDARHALPELRNHGSRKQRESGSPKPRPAPPRWVAAVKAAATGILAGDVDSRSQLQKLLGEGNADADALRVLSRDKKVAPALRTLLRDADARMRAMAASALAGDVEARAELRLLLEDPAEEVREAAAAALAGDVPSRPALRALLKIDHWLLRMDLATFLAGDTESGQVLLALIRDKDPWVSRTAQRALAMDAQWKPAMRSMLQSDNPGARRQWAEVLVGDEESKPSFRVLLADEEADVRAAAAAGLVGDVEARPTLRKLLKDASANVRAAAARALVGDAKARPALLKLVRDTEESRWGHMVGEEAAKALAADPVSRKDLRKLLKDSDSDVRRAAAEALEGDVESLSALRPLLKDPDWRVRQSVASVLAKDGESTPALRELLKDGDEGVQRTVAEALVGDPESRPHFRGFLSARKEMRLLAVRALRAGVRPSAGEALSSHVIPGKFPGLVALKALREVLASGHPFLEERLDAFIRAPQPLRLERNPDFAEAILGWLCARLGHASKDGRLLKGRLHGEFPPGMPERLFQPGATLLIRVSMDADDLPVERFLYPLHNLIEAWRVARYLRAENPPAFVLACANVDFSDLQAALPELAPGQLVTGPTFFGFRVPRGQAPTGDPTLLLSASTLAAELWDQASPEERARHISVLAGLVDDPDLDPWVLVPLLARVGHLLPPGLRAELANRLPSSVEGAEQLLQQATRGLRQKE